MRKWGRITIGLNRSPPVDPCSTGRQNIRTILLLSPTSGGLSLLWSNKEKTRPVLILKAVGREALREPKTGKGSYQRIKGKESGE